MPLELKSKTKRIQKNLTLSEDACRLIDTVAKKHNTSPSLIVEQLAEHYLSIILGEKRA